MNWETTYSVSKLCGGSKPLGFGFGVGDDMDAAVGLDLEGYDVTSGKLCGPHFGSGNPPWPLDDLQRSNS